MSSSVQALEEDSRLAEFYKAASFFIKQLRLNFFSHKLLIIHHSSTKNLKLIIESTHTSTEMSIHKNYCQIQIWRRSHMASLQISYLSLSKYSLIKLKSSKLQHSNPYNFSSKLWDAL